MRQMLLKLAMCVFVVQSAIGADKGHVILHKTLTLQGEILELELTEKPFAQKLHLEDKTITQDGFVLELAKSRPALNDHSSRVIWRNFFVRPVGALPTWSADMTVLPGLSNL